jgi:hypothetical protein
MGSHFCYVPFEISFLEKQRAINMVTADVTFLTQPMPRALIPVVQLQAGEFELKTRRCRADQGGAHAGAAAGRGMDRSSVTFAGGAPK